MFESGNIFSKMNEISELEENAKLVDTVFKAHQISATII